jgi:prepilin-type N-terminal cleavage/methylation domain-containing protein
MGNSDSNVRSESDSLRKEKASIRGFFCIMQKKYSGKGFTLIELIVMMAILGILSAFIVPKYRSMEEKVHSAVLRQYYVEIDTALRLYGHFQLATNCTKRYPKPSEYAHLDTLLLESQHQHLSYRAADEKTGYFIYTGKSDSLYLKYTHIAGPPERYSLEPTLSDNYLWANSPF